MRGVTGVLVFFGVIALSAYMLVGSLRASEVAQSKLQSTRSIRFSSNLKVQTGINSLPQPRTSPLHAFARSC